MPDPPPMQPPHLPEKSAPDWSKILIAIAAAISTGGALYSNVQSDHAGESAQLAKITVEDVIRVRARMEERDRNSEKRDQRILTLEKRLDALESKTK